MTAIRLDKARALRELVKIFCTRSGISKATEDLAVKSIFARLKSDESAARVYRQIKNDLRTRVAA